MRKYVKLTESNIATCFSCPFSRWKEGEIVCSRLTPPKIIEAETLEDPIPEWCPLPDVEKSDDK